MASASPGGRARAVSHPKVATEPAKWAISTSKIPDAPELFLRRYFGVTILPPIDSR